MVARPCGCVLPGFSRTRACDTLAERAQDLYDVYWGIQLNCVNNQQSMSAQILVCGVVCTGAWGFASSLGLTRHAC